MWQKDGRDDTSDQSLARIDHLPATLKLIAITCLLKDVPSLVGGDIS